MNKSTIMDQSV